MKELKDPQDIYKMKLHEERKVYYDIDDNMVEMIYLSVLCVPGGWIYRVWGKAVRGDVMLV